MSVIGPMRTRDQGFTLVELLLSIGLMSILLGLAYGGLTGATRAVDRGQDNLDQTVHVRAAHQFLRRQLTHALPLTFNFIEESGTRVVFEGSPDSLQFVATMPGYLGYGGPQLQRIDLAPDGDSGALYFSHATLAGFGEQPIWQGDPVLLLRDVEEVSYLYLSRERDGTLGDWTDFWAEPELVPVAISMDVRLADDSVIQWPLLVANVRIDQDSFDDAAEGGDYEEAIRSLIRGRRENGQ